MDNDSGWELPRTNGPRWPGDIEPKNAPSGYRTLARRRRGLLNVNTSCILVVTADGQPGFHLGSGEGAGEREEARSNVRRSGVGLSDDRARLIDDPEHSAEESRFILLGLSARARVLVVVPAYHAPAGVIRIISARKATPRERSQYDGGDRV